MDLAGTAAGLHAISNNEL